MGFKEKFNSVMNKVTDVVMDAQQTFEKGCENVSCYSLKDLRDGEEVRAKIDDEFEIVQFSSVLDVSLKKVARPWIFVTEKGSYFILKEGSVEQKTIDVQLKSKTEKHVITEAQIEKVELKPIKI